MSCSAAVSAAMSASSKTLCRSGRFKVMMPMPPSTSVRTVSAISAPRLPRAQSCADGLVDLCAFAVNVSHAKYAEARRLERCIECRGKPEAEHAPRLCRVDHAVIPQPRRGVVGVPLALILAADRFLEHLFVLRAPALARRLQGVALDLGENGCRLLTPHHRDAGVRPHP